MIVELYKNYEIILRTIPLVQRCIFEIRKWEFLFRNSLDKKSHPFLDQLHVRVLVSGVSS